jgi:hypothetical protein
MTEKKKIVPKPKQPKPATNKKSREDVNQAAFRVVKEATEKD